MEAGRTQEVEDVSLSNFWQNNHKAKEVVDQLIDRIGFDFCVRNNHGIVAETAGISSLLHNPTN